MTQSCGEKLQAKAKESGGRLRVTALDPRVVEHCAVPTSELGGLLNPPGREREFGDVPLPLPQRIVEAAEGEWRNWGQGTVTEADPAATPLLSEYYRFGVRETVSPGQLQSKSWQNDHPWSAVFVSYVMRTAGAGDAFAYAAAHTAYVAAAKRATARRDGSKFQAFPIDRAPIEVGDVVCRDRLDVRSGHCYGTTFENAESGGHSHGEIVLEVNPRQGYAITIGGNTSQDYPQRGLNGNTVGKHKIPVDGRGFVISRGHCAFFAVLKSPRQPGTAAPSGLTRELPVFRRQASGPPVTVHLSESQLKEWVRSALEGAHVIGSVAEVLEIFHGSAAWPAIEASLTWGEAAMGAGAGVGVLAPLIEIAVPLGYVALIGLTFFELYEAFSTGTRIQTKKGYCYGIMWAALGMPNQPRDFQPWAGDSADKLRAAFEKGVNLGRDKFKSDTKLHNQVLLRLAYEQMTQDRHRFTRPEGRVLNLIWEQLHGDDIPDTHISWEKGSIGQQYNASTDNDLIPPGKRPPS